jgi:hypothetical protein
VDSSQRPSIGRLRAAATSTIIVTGCMLVGSILSSCASKGVGATPSDPELRSREATNAAVAPPGPSLPANPAPADQAPAREPSESAEAAVLALLKAEQAGNHRASFAFLSRSGLARFANSDAWASHRRATAPVTAFHTESVVGAAVTVLVEHTPAIDPFLGLQFARERQIWQAHEEPDGWLVDPEPEIRPIVPSDAGAREVTARWSAARQSCNEELTTSLQAVTTPFGVSRGASALCKTTDVLSVGIPTWADPGPQTAQLVEQYGPAVVRYIRSVPVAGGPEPFTVLLVPIGDVWRVIGIND